MEIRVRVEERGNAQLQSLYRWITTDLNISADAKFKLQSVPAEAGRMGPDASTLNAVVGNVLALGSLVVSIAAWRKSSHSRPNISLETENVQVLIDADIDDVDQVVLRLTSDNHNEEAG